MGSAFGVESQDVRRPVRTRQLQGDVGSQRPRGVRGSVPHGTGGRDRRVVGLVSGGQAVPVGQAKTELLAGGQLRTVDFVDQRKGAVADGSADHLAQKSHDLDKEPVLVKRRQIAKANAQARFTSRYTGRPRKFGVGPNGVRGVLALVRNGRRKTNRRNLDCIASAFSCMRSRFSIFGRIFCRSASSLHRPSSSSSMRMARWQ